MRNDTNLTSVSVLVSRQSQQQRNPQQHQQEQEERRGYSYSQFRYTTPDQITVEDLDKQTLSAYSDAGSPRIAVSASSVKRIIKL